MPVPTMDDEGNFDDGWDWRYIKYSGRIVLKMSEEEFWRTTPRELNALVKVHIEVNTPKKKKKGITGYIDQVL